MRRNNVTFWFKASVCSGLMGPVAVACGSADDTSESPAKGGKSAAGGSTSGAGGKGGSSGRAAAETGGSTAGSAPDEGGTSGTGGSETGGSAGRGTAGRSGSAGRGASAGSGGTQVEPGTSGEGGQSGEGGAAGASGATSPCAVDGALCDGGLCSGGSCLAPAVVSSDTDLSAGPLTTGRSCAEAPAFSVTALTSTSATLDTAPEGDCLTSGDEVLLINLQGTPDATPNIGNWELLTVHSVADTTVTFEAPTQRSYGVAEDSNAEIGTGSGDQKVALLRVPHFGALTIPDGVTLTSSPWDGSKGGVVALRAAALDVAGTISAASLGYRPGHWSTDSSDCRANVTTEAGESITGPGTQTTSHNAGGPGGLGAGTDLFFVDNSPICASAGHAAPGEAGINPDGRVMGEPGAAYGAGDGSRLTLGSGAAGNITCTTFDTGPGLQTHFNNTQGGGVVLLLVDTLTVRASGSITATPPDASRDVSASGGYVLIRGNHVAVGDGQITALGATAHSGSTPTAGMSNRSSAGYVVLQTANAVDGTTDPVANVVP